MAIIAADRRLIFGIGRFRRHPSENLILLNEDMLLEDAMQRCDLDLGESHIFSLSSIGVRVHAT